MPLTINGIGTMYYGKRNLRTYPGTCEACRKSVQLADYETTLFFVVLYIPLLPLGRKQLLHACPACRRHAVLPAKKWQAVKQAALEESTQSLASQMDSPEAGLAHLQTLAELGELEEARDLAEAMELQYAARAEVQLALGAWHERQGHKADADRCFQTAFKLEPTNPAMIRAQGLTLLEQGQLEEARQLLSQLQPPHPSFDPTIFSTLGRAFQDRQRHDEALELFGIAAQDSGLRENKTFRKLVRKSERATGSKRATWLPPVRLWQRTGFRVAAGLAAVATLWLVITWYQGQNRTLNIINSSPQKITVQLDGTRQVTIFPNSHQGVTIPEGLHRVVVTDPPQAGGEKTFLVQTPWWQRAFSNPCCVLDPQESSLIYWRKVWYRITPDDSQDELDTHFGQLYVQYPRVNFLFVDFPQQIELRKGRPASRTGIAFKAMDVGMLKNTGLEGEALLQRAEDLLKLQGGELEDALSYFYLCAEAEREDRAIAFFESLLDRRPVMVPIHRLYQNLVDDSPERFAELRRRYDEQLAADPRNADLLFLRSCLETNYQEARVWLEQVQQLDPNQVEVWQSACRAELAVGNFPFAFRILEQHPLELADWPLAIEVEFASGAEGALFRRLASSSQDLDTYLAVRRLYRQIGANFSGPPQSEREWELFRGLSGIPDRPGIPNPNAGQGGLEGLAATQLDSGDFYTLQLYAAYISDRPEELERLLKSPDPLAGDVSYWRFVYELQHGSVITLVKAAADLEDEIEPLDELLVAIRLQLEGEAEQAEAWLESVLESLRAGRRTERAWAEFLDRCRREPIPLDQLQQLLETAEDKAICLTAILAFSAEPDSGLRELAGKFAFNPSPPMQFVHWALAHPRLSEARAAAKE